MKTETDILVEISCLEVELSKEKKEDTQDDIKILKIQTKIDTLKWVLEN
jgi:hypothetical protein